MKYVCFLAVFALGACAGEPAQLGSRGTEVQIPEGYYSSVDSSGGASMRLTLHQVIDDHQRFPYTSTATDTWDILEQADQDLADPAYIIDVYKNARYLKTGGGVGPYNREHSWPNSYGFPNDNASNYPYTDCHALFLADSSYNSSRSNNLYRECSAACNEKTTEYNDGRGGGSGVYPGNSNWADGTGLGIWQTWSGRKGDVARALLYLDIRYEGGTHAITGVAEPDLRLTDDEALIAASNTGQNEAVAYMGMLSRLIAWHKADPVDNREILRNEVVYGHQGNRNPFIDHPEWVDCIYNNVCNGGGDQPPAVSIVQPAGGSTVAGSVTIQVDAIDAEDPPGTLQVAVSIDGGPLQAASYNPTAGLYELAWNTAETSDGGHTIDARAMDSAANGADATTVHVNVGNNPDLLHVGDLDATRSTSGPLWQAHVTITVHDAAHAPRSSVTVQGRWGASEPTSCTTDGSGRCTVSSAKMKNKVGSVVFAVTGLSHPTASYQPADNHDPDGDSDGTTIVVAQQAADSPPQVAIAQPSNGSTVSGSVTVQVDATDAEDAAGSLQVTVSIDGGANQPAAYNAASGRYELTWDTTGVADGGHTIDARASDSAGNATDAAQVAVTASNGSTTGTSHVGDLDGSVDAKKTKWRATVRVAVHDGNHLLVSGAVVQGSWSDGAATSCTTDSSGGCTLTSGFVPLSQTSIGFAVSSVAHPALSYDAGANHDPDGDSDGTSIVVAR